MKKIVLSILFISLVYIVSAQTDSKQNNINSHQKTAISKDKNYYTMQVKDTGTVAKKVSIDTSKGNKKVPLSYSKYPIQTGKQQNQQPGVADTSVIHKQSPAYRARKVVLSNQKDPVIK